MCARWCCSDKNCCFLEDKCCCCVEVEKADTVDQELFLDGEDFEKMFYLISDKRDPKQAQLRETIVRRSVLRKVELVIIVGV